MKVIPKIINNFVVTPREKSVILTINESLEVEYLLSENSNNEILQDLVEARAFATALLYLNETYKLVTNNKLFKENKVEDYYEDCNSLLKENIVIVEEKGIPLVSINGYYIYESDKGILRGNGKKKLKESFDDNISIDEFITGKWKVILKNDKNGIIVSFIDISQDKEKFPDGQPVYSYYLDTLFDGKYNEPIDQMNEFRLDNEVPAWTIKGEDLTKIANWLKQFYTNNLNESDTDLAPEVQEAIKQFIIDSFTNDTYKHYGFGLRKPYTSDGWMLGIYKGTTGNLPSYETLSKMRKYYESIYEKVVKENNLKESNSGINVEDLAWDLVNWGEDFDTYDFKDNYNDKEEAFEETMKSLNSKSQIKDLIIFIKNAIEDTPENDHEREESLIARLEQLLPTLNEEGEGGTQVGDIAPKVDQNMNGKTKNKDKKYYDILLSGIDESMDSILNKGFMKNIHGQYERDGYILIKENNRFIAVRKDKLIEEYDGQMSIDENGLPELPNPYHITKRNDNRYQITSSHPYDLTDYSWAVSVEDNIDGLWKVYEPNPDCSIYMDISRRPSQYLFIDAVKGWDKALELLQKLDATKTTKIDKT